MATMEAVGKQRLITVHDAATVRWEPDAARPAVDEQLAGLTDDEDPVRPRLARGPLSRE